MKLGAVTRATVRKPGAYWKDPFRRPSDEATFADLLRSGNPSLIYPGEVIEHPAIG